MLLGVNFNRSSDYLPLDGESVRLSWHEFCLAWLRLRGRVSLQG